MEQVALSETAKLLCKKFFYDKKRKTYCDGNGCPSDFRDKCVEKIEPYTPQKANKNTVEMNEIAEKYTNLISEVRNEH